MKQDDDKTNENDVKRLHPETDPVIHRTLKCQRLADTLFKDVETFTKENGALSIFELNDVFIKLIHSFNKQQLMKEYQNLKNEHDFKKMKGSSKGKK